jgi:two-component system OmpR family sensor kinase
VVDNLMDNAVSASARTTGAARLVVVGAVRAEGSVRISVTDCGPGMPDDEKAHAFDRFWRSPSSEPGAGSGLGLAIVQRLVASARGTVRLDDGPDGVGLRAVVDLPAG